MERGGTDGCGQNDKRTMGKLQKTNNCIEQTHMTTEQFRICRASNCQGRNSSYVGWNEQLLDALSYRIRIFVFVVGADYCTKNQNS